MSIFNSDDSKRGYEKGIADAEQGKDKNHLGMGLSAKFLLYGNDSSSSYVKAYDQGYLHGMAKQYGVFYPPSVTTTTGTAMQANNIHATANDEAIASFQEQVAQFGKQLAELTRELHNYIAFMQQGSWDDPNYLEFRQLFSRLTHRVEGIEHSVIQQSMLPVLQNHIEAIRAAQMKGRG
ncbi:hypothetical protein SNE85_000724 [Vibrio cholerae]|uniref:hypothetical protein n=1 Tax=Vibrio cholerae TaxID=666 RepID=UPI002A18092A|nr:hypothetical protein [Vibrio cholerae]